MDRCTGNAPADLRPADHGLAAQGMAVGIAPREGQMGLGNVALDGLACHLIVALCLSGLVPRWKRRPAGAWRLAAPPAPAGCRSGKALALAIALSMPFPLVGLTLIAVAVLYALVARQVAPLRRTPS